MINAKRILIETESREVFTVRIREKSGIRTFCLDCGMDTEMLSIDQAVTSSGIAGLEIMRQISTGEIHFSQAASGHVLICERSVGTRG